MKEILSRWRVVIDQWSTQTFYQRFESIVALVLTLLITLVIIVALFRLLVGVVGGLVFGALNPLEYTVFQTVFGEIMTLLIALEFNHTLQYVVNRQQSIIQTKVVLLIALLALARKLIILDLKTTPPEVLFGLAGVTLAVGVTYWLMRERDDRVEQERDG
ncbi:MAG TPA: hypothetical protein DEO56_09500 [Nitrosomonas nitrosa]|jgi:uncharacterized membrane protein (DUF373 family)|uniref:Uncharacterized membrane protein, DUF373 family n=1 Tax=Nitrosomonas nitrosa TaxID=52442 RepID=A0A1I4NU87_9PROT|nr:phosphate-starvation-inducible PsiE family protein [Nitrosomonas nitrosa]MCO6432945.1 phosphate-starvation-inducible PsiE family protein [Nitrosomonas nitrosa]PTR00661.1 uncharacterized membrane protein (DUF373 family) [Nitrosomonas nitrosa]CAE6516415.1 conserved membrane hypothetical protein [Nitrosomonas nitrosa]SFM18986.1 Uncharacterized membrane protein, DUF373 family [Nitrosomonas nitrosa]HBZ30812.1 hypothetical protein [Nitrosomonas nitrosa]